MSRIVQVDDWGRISLRWAHRTRRVLRYRATEGEGGSILLVPIDDGQGVPGVSTGELVPAPERWAPPDGTCRGCGVAMPAGLHPFPWCDLMKGDGDAG